MFHEGRRRGIDLVHACQLVEDLAAHRPRPLALLVVLVSLVLLVLLVLPAA